MKNGNNFYSKASCEATCTRSMNVQDLRTSISSNHKEESRGDASMVKFGEDSPSSSSTKSVTTGDITTNSICTLPKQTGVCRAYVTRYYYDTETRTCTTFIYGGCRGNFNRFKTLKQCQSRCPEENEGAQARFQPTPIQGKPNEENKK